MRQRGVAGFVVQMTLASVALSVVMVAVISGLAWGPSDPTFLPGLIIGAVVPALVAPPVLVFCVRVAAGLDRASRLLWEAAHTDALTGLANRRAFFERLEHTEGLATVPVDVAVVDLDGFKKINDRHGHAAGDRALQEVARWLTELAGPAGTVARMGGDEFALVVPVADGPERPTRHRFEHQDLDWSVTLGWYRCPTGCAIEDALREADIELYARKPVRSTEPGVSGPIDGSGLVLDDAHND